MGSQPGHFCGDCADNELAGPAVDPLTLHQLASPNIVCFSMVSAASFTLTTTSTAKVLRAYAATAAKVTSPNVATLFVAGQIAEQAPRLAKALSAELPDHAFVLAVGTGVLNERQEVEGESAAAGLLWADPTARVLSLESGPHDHASQLDQLMRQHGASTAFVLLRPDKLDSSALSRLALKGRSIFGAGTSSTQNILTYDGSGHLKETAAAALLSSAAAPMLGTTRASRLITQLSPITRASGNLLLEIGGEDALDVLSSAGQGLQGQPLIFVALASEAMARGTSTRSVDVLMRPIQGVDPARRGIMLTEEVTPGTYAAFAIRDAGAARSDLESMLRELGRDSAGAMPRFAIYVNCAGRGRGLYEAPNVDTRMIRSRFGAIPMVGFQSAFELAPYADHLALHLYTGVLALFTSPS